MAELDQPYADVEMQREMESEDQKRHERILKEEMTAQKHFDKLIEDEKKGKTAGPQYEVDPLASYLKRLFDDAEGARKLTEMRWQKDFMQYRGEYTTELLANMPANRSKAYIRFTRAKVKSATARLMEFLFPANGEKNWGISPTPIPELSPSQMELIVQQYTSQYGEEITPAALRKLIYDTAHTASNKMSKVIEDQLSDIRYRDIMKDVLHSGNLYGTGILKGPFIKVNRTQKYIQGPDGNWNPLTIERLVPFCESVSVWDFYPDMSAKTIDKCRYMFQRHKMNKHQVSSLAKRPDFNQKAIQDYLTWQAWGDHIQKGFENELDASGDIVTLNASADKDRVYDVLEYWGYIDANDMMALGVDIPERQRGSMEVKANIWILGDKVIKAALSPVEGTVWPYYMYYYDKDESSIFGEGLSAILRDPQELMNAAFRAMLDNAAISAGPQIEANMELLGPDEDPTDIHPHKVWLRTGTGLEAQQEAIRVHTLPSYTNEYINMIQLIERMGDEVSTLPRFFGAQGNAANLGGSQRTQGGLSMLLGTANITIKDQVKNFDDGITSPFLKAMYHWNMEFGGDPEVKGDFDIVARGSSSLVAKEVYLQQLMQFYQITNNPMDAQYIDRLKLLRETSGVLDLSEKSFIKSDETIQAEQEQAAQQAQSERDFAMRITELARQGGVSPEDLLNSINELRNTLSQGGGEVGAPQ